MVFVPSNEDKMQQIFQSFELDLERMTGLGTEALSKLNLPKAGIALRDALVFEGYTVLESSGSFNGVATGVIVGGSIETSEVTAHTRANIYACEAFLGKIFIVSSGIISSNGFQNNL